MKRIVSGDRTVSYKASGGLDEAQAGIKIAGTNINNLRYADDTTLMAESEEELKSLLMKVKEESEVGLKLNIQKTKIMAVWGGLTNSCEKKRSEKQRRKGKDIRKGKI